MHALLVMFKPDGTRRDFSIKPDRRYIIGRREESDLRIPLREVSREHAAIFFDEEEDELVIEDLGSSNGIFVNDERTERAELCPGDVVVIGNVPFQVVIDGHPTELEPLTVRPTAPQPESEGDPAGATADNPTTIASSAPATASASESESDSNVDSFFGFDLDDDDI